MLTHNIAYIRTYVVYKYISLLKCVSECAHMKTSLSTWPCPRLHDTGMKFIPVQSIHTRARAKWLVSPPILSSVLGGIEEAFGLRELILLTVDH